MQSNQFQPTDKLVLTEEGLQPVYSKGKFRYIKNDTDGFTVYELVDSGAVLDKEVALDKYPEEVL
jgi:hypothetical protein